MTKLMKNEWVLHFLIMTLKEEILRLLYVTSFHLISYVYKQELIIEERRVSNAIQSCYK